MQAQKYLVIGKTKLQLQVNKRILKRYQNVSEPADPNVVLTKTEKEKNLQFPYRESAGSLMFAAVVTTPDIMFSVGEVSRFMENPSKSHIEAVKRILKYLKRQPVKCIKYGPEKTELVDADFARDVDTRKSTSGYVFIYDGGPITWCTRQQNLVALSTTEAEFIACCEGTNQAIWLRQLLNSIGQNQSTSTIINVDNNSAIGRIKSYSHVHNRTNHIDDKYNFIKEACKNNLIDVNSVTSDDQLANMFTKPLVKIKFEKNVVRIGMSGESSI